MNLSLDDLQKLKYLFKQKYNLFLSNFTGVKRNNFNEYEYN